MSYKLDFGNKFSESKSFEIFGTLYQCRRPVHKLHMLSMHNLVNTIARAVSTPRQHNVVSHYNDTLYVVYIVTLYVVYIAWPEALRTGAYRLEIIAWRGSGHARLLYGG